MTTATGKRARRVMAVVMGAIMLGGGAGKALAWGGDGHRAIAEIAAQFIAPSTAEEVKTLLGGWGPVDKRMVAASTWADEVRVFRPATGPWHFINIPLRAAGADMQRDCPQGDCIIAALDRFADVLRDRSLAPAVRAEALKNIIHMVGDVHQPLHVSDNRDHGGNALHVVVGGAKRSLHQVWDTDLVEAVEQQAGVRQGGTELGAWIAGQISPQQRRQWATGGPIDWANEAHTLAGQVAYAGISGSGGSDAGAPIVLGPQYLQQAVPVVEMQLAIAGVRLAAELDMVLGR